MKEIVILGSTGSIGTQTLEVINNNKDMHVKALAAGSNTDLAEKQANTFMPELVCIYDSGKALELKKRLETKGNSKTKVVTGMEE